MGTFINWVGAGLIIGAAYAALTAEPVSHAPPPSSSVDPTPPPIPTAPPMRLVRGGTISVAPDRNAQFWIGGSANNASLKFLIDTGAAGVSLSQADAARAGIDCALLTFDIRLATAHGEGRAARAWLRHLAAGPLIFENVPVLVVEDGLSDPLLGMSLLRAVQFTVQNGTLKLSGRVVQTAIR